MKIEKIVLTTDFSDHARQAYACAVDFTTRFNAELYLVHFAGALPALISGTKHNKDVDSLKSALVDETNHSCLVETKVTSHLQNHRWTPARQKALEYELEVDLIVMAPKGKTGLTQMLLGSFADRVVRNASVPVLIFRGNEVSDTLHPRTVLVPHDFYDSPTAVIPAMRLLAEQFGSKFQFLHVYDPSLLNSQSTRDMEQQFATALNSPLARPIEERFAQLVEEDLGGLDVNLETLQGFPSLQVVQRANQLPADLVLLGKRAGLGGVARSVIWDARCSVLAVPLQ